MKRHPKVKIGAELTAEANRWADEAAETMASYIDREILLALHTQALRFTETEIMRAIAKRIEDLKRRGYPQAWIEKDIERLVAGL